MIIFRIFVMKFFIRPIMNLLQISCIAGVILSGQCLQSLTAAEVVPKPLSVVEARGSYILPAALTFSVNDDTAGLAGYISASPLGASEAVKGKRADMTIIITGKGKPESYEMKITSRGISIKASDEAGAFYAVQTLLQMTADGSERTLPCVTVTDSPRFSYRGLHMDVSRHFRSKDFVKKQIDAMALLKLNNLHLHLTDGAGWRMAIDAYPRLTEYASWRPQRSWQDWRDSGAGYCESTHHNAYGGYYTKEDLREIVEYAAARHINVIPEIEMPGHSEEVLAAYPGLACPGHSGGGDLCPGKEATFKFLEDVVSEVIDVFPSEYIHIGGDEAAKDAWRECPDCRARMDAEGLNSVEQLQSYLITRMERFINSKGRKIIGWDEILEGGVAPNATVMSWRGTEGGVAALKSGHDAIMTPAGFCYLDYTQDAPFREPASIGGYTPLRTVYSYEPLVSGLSDDEASHLLGVQANLWSEYITDDSHAEYMYYPRVYAIAEIGWSAPEKNYDGFHNRALALNELMAARGYTVFDLGNEYGNRRETLAPVAHMGRGAKVSYANPYHSKYPASGDGALTDGVRGGWNHADGRWQGTLNDMDLTVDLGSEKSLHYIGASFLHSEGAWIHLPEKVTISVSSDGVTFSPMGVVWCDVDPAYPKTMAKEYGIPVDVTARYIRLQAVKNPRPGAWLFTDEIVIN